MSADARPSAALEGTVVVDLSQHLPGPYATLLLAGLGARILKIEPPAGDPLRHADPEMFETVNAGKESIVLDLKTARGRAALHDLVAGSEVFIEGFRSGAADRLGASFQTLAKVQPRLVYCAMSGFGDAGPYRMLPGHEVNYLGLAGGLDIPDPGEGLIPHRRIPVVDLATGSMAALTVLAALLGSERRQRAVYLDVAMLDSAVFWAAMIPAPSTAAAYGVVRCGDGLPLSTALVFDESWNRFCRAVGWDDWLEDERFATSAGRAHHADTIRTRLTETLRTRPRSHWLRKLWDADVPVAPVWRQEDVPSDPHVVARRLFDPSGQTALRPPIPAALSTGPLAAAPRLGADTRAVLGGLCSRAPLAPCMPATPR